MKGRDGLGCGEYFGPTRMIQLGEEPFMREASNIFGYMLIYSDSHGRFSWCRFRPRILPTLERWTIDEMKVRVVEAI